MGLTELGPMILFFSKQGIEKQHSSKTPGHLGPLHLLQGAVPSPVSCFLCVDAHAVPCASALHPHTVPAHQHSVLLTAIQWADLIFNGRMRQALCLAGPHLPSSGLLRGGEGGRGEGGRRGEEGGRRRRYALGCASSLALRGTRKRGRELGGGMAWWW